MTGVVAGAHADRETGEVHCQEGLRKELGGGPYEAAARHSMR